MFGKAQFAKSRKKKPFTSLILTWLSIMYEVCFLDTPSVLIGLNSVSTVAYSQNESRNRTSFRIPMKSTLFECREFKIQKNFEIL